MQTASVKQGSADEPLYLAVPLSIQKEGDVYVVGNADTGEFYQVPEQGVQILNMLKSGDAVARIKTQFGEGSAYNLDVDTFIRQMTDIGFLYRSDSRSHTPKPNDMGRPNSQRIFDVHPRVAKAIFSFPAMIAYLAIILFAISEVIAKPALRPNTDALYTEQNRTLLLVIILGLSSVQTVLHELGHMLAAARQGIKSRYGLGNRLWTIVAESDLTGILSLPKAQRYLPMLAGLLVDILSLALLTLLLDAMFWYGVAPFAVQVIQIMVLETLLAMAWQFNVFVKTDIYFVLCTYFSYPDLDRDARAYLGRILYKASFGWRGLPARPARPEHLPVLRLFAAIWLLGRILSVFILVAVFLPTMWQYGRSAVRTLNGSSESLWAACDTILYVSILLTMLGVGMYMWLTNRGERKQDVGEFA